MNLYLLLVQLVSAGARGSEHGWGKPVGNARYEAGSPENESFWGTYMAPFDQGPGCLFFYYISMWKDYIVIAVLQGEKWVTKTDDVLCTMCAKAGSILPPTHQLHLKIKINQSSFWHCQTERVTDSVFDMSFNRVGSRRHSYSESGVMPGIKHSSGPPSHLADCSFIFRVSNKKILKKKKKKDNSVSGNQEWAI